MKKRKKDKKHITVIGGNSGIGLALVHKLLDKEYDVTCIVRSPLPEKVKYRVMQVEADILEDDQAEMAAFLLSRNSSWITGQTMPVDGGLSTLKV